MSKFRTEPDHEETGYPSGIPFIIGNEGCERFSYYGMRAILYIYIVGLYVNLRGMAEPDAEKTAGEVYHLFNAGVYALPLIGAIISDRLLGKYMTILSLSIVYCLGHVALALFENPTWQHELLGHVYVDPIQGLYIGLALIALGSGGIKPCVSAHVGDQFGRSNWHLLQNIFNAFYFIINFGSSFATIFIPIIRGDLVQGPEGHYHYDGSVSWAFGVPGILMGLATLFFYAGRKRFVHVPPSHPNMLGFLDVLAGISLFMAPAYPVFLTDLTGPWVTLAISLGCLVAFVVLYGIRQRFEQDDGFMALTFYTLRVKLFGGDPGEGSPPESEDQPDLRNHPVYGPAARRFGSELAEGPVAVWRIISIFFLVMLFWALFDQHSSTWIAQAKAMDRSVEMGLFGWLVTGALLGALVGFSFLLTARRSREARGVIFAIGVVGGLVLGGFASLYGPSYELQASQIPAANPFMVMVLIPLTNFGLYPGLRKLGIEPHALWRMTVGMLMTGVSFVMVALLQAGIEATPEGEQSIHVGWQLIPYFVLTLSEVMVSITGLEFAYTQAPPRMKSVVMGFWLLTVTAGNLLASYILHLKGLSLGQQFWIFAALMGIAAVIFAVRAKFYTYRDYSQ